jgi:hypothetical protein
MRGRVQVRLVPSRLPLLLESWRNNIGRCEGMNYAASVVGTSLPQVHSFDRGHAALAVDYLNLKDHLYVL